MQNGLPKNIMEPSCYCLIIFPISLLSAGVGQKEIKGGRRKKKIP